MKKVTFLLMTLFAFSSCETETFVDYYIDNQSSTTITISGSNIISATEISSSISVGEEMEISNWSKLGKQTDLFEPVTMFGEDLIITNVAGDSLVKDYKILSNWISDVDDQRATASHKYTLHITDADF